ncbi:MAG: N-acetylmuramoyl-L-alanine amidase [Ruminococcus sp.]|nr:N-acetylmuramoyl-L-alanine amidase [Ruminococcus sp.]
MTDEEFREKYGRDPVKPGQHTKVKVYWDRIIIALILLILLIFGIVKGIMAIVGAIKGSGDDSSSVTDAAVSVSDESSPDESEDDSSQQENISYQFIVCLDPGHGGEDGGATDKSGKRWEKDDTFKMCTRIKEILEAKGVTVALTRNDDVLLSLEEICTAANDSKADLFVSIHRNSAEEKFKGVEIWVNNHEPESDTLLASNLLTALDRVGINENRNVNYGFIGEPQSNYQVNRQTHMPSCLVELGFITNDKDNELLDKNFDAYAEAMADAIIKTAKELGIVDEQGSRLHEGQYLSTKPQWDPATNTYHTEDGDVVYADAIDPNAEDKNLKRTDIPAQQDTQQTDANTDATQQNNADGTVG